MPKKIFSGHESFNCRPLWLKKGYDFTKSGNSFSDASSVVQLGVGKNMVSSIYFWMHSFGLIDISGSLTALADFLFGEKGKDPYLENPASLWLLQYNLIKTQRASLYSIFFNNFRRERIEFTKDQIKHFVKRQCGQENISINEKTLKKDIDVFLKTYLKPQRAKKNFEDEYSGLFIDLKLINRLEITERDNQTFSINIGKHEDIPPEIILFLLLEQFEDKKSISFSNIMYNDSSPGICFALNEEGLTNHILSLTKKYKITLTEDAGIKELQMNEKIDKWKVLKNCYEK